jgi:cytochrome c peroxidase
MTAVSAHRKPAGVIGALLLMLLVTGSGAPAQADGPEAPDRSLVGRTDPREGYESDGFHTRSVQVKAESGHPLDLAALARNPPLGLPSLKDPPEAAEIDRGRRLFFDRRLSANETLSCAMCHVPEQAFTQNELATPVGIEGRFVRRNAPALYNVAYRRHLFHDGRESSLSEQIFSPLTAANEMGNPDRQAVLERIAALPGYAGEFDALFTDGLTEGNLGQVLAAYQRALLSADAPFDRWFYGGDADAMTAVAREGFFVFTASGCAGCHAFSNAHAHFTDDAFHRTGVEVASRAREARPQEALQIAPGVIVPLAVTIPPPDRRDRGREEVTGVPADRYRYRTPSLRNVALTAPYMHDGSLRTLDDVIDFYSEGVREDPDRDPRLEPLALDTRGKLALLAFLESLTGTNVDALARDARSVPIGERGAGSGAPQSEERNHE